ncbi:protoporphyrinogen/coproporphyrinogen oxidase [bacterium]
MKNIIIIGGGLAGLSAAYFLNNKKIPFELFEKENSLGGLCRTVEHGGFSFDYTGHLLHFSDKSIKNLVTDILGNNLHSQFRKSWIYSHGVYSKYPFQVNTYRLPENVKKDCLFGYLKAYFNKKNEEKNEFNNFVDWVMYNFGKGIGEHFMLPYNKKLWAIEPDKLTVSWLNKYVPNPDLDEVIHGAFSDKDEKLGYNASFYYPKKDGIQALIKGFSERLNKENIALDSDVKKIDLNKKTIIVNAKEIEFDFLISSAPLKNLILDIITDVPSHIRKEAEKLRANTVLNINLGVNKIIADKHWIYFPEEEYIFYRVGFNNNFSEYMAPKGCSSIYTEIAFPHDIKEENYENYTNIVIKDLIKAGILKNKDEVISTCPLKLSPAYVIYDKNRDEAVSKIILWLKSQSIIPIGRYGLWEYSAMEDAIKQGKNAAREMKTYGF